LVRASGTLQRRTCAPYDIGYRILVHLGGFHGWSVIGFELVVFA
jgi:hypothetical protein